MSANGRAGIRIALIAAVMAVAVFGIPMIAYAYSSGFPGSDDCDQCHATDSQPSSALWEGKGPHGYYTATTRKCAVCHSLHDAPVGGILLLTDSTISGTCLACHDGTGGTAPYDAIEARGGVVLSEHSIDTAVIPGGSQNLAEVLGCGDCHSVHRSGVVDPFIRDSGIALDSNGGLIASDCLLKSDVNTTTADAFPVYGARWCASCHDERGSELGMTINHPVNTSGVFGYGEVTSTAGAQLDRADGWAGGSVLGMGRTNGAYVMAPVDEVADGRVENRQDPMCQQCHEDARDVETKYDANYSDPNPVASGYDPLYITYPHQATNLYFLVESNDDLCLNCHNPSALP